MATFSTAPIIAQKTTTDPTLHQLYWYVIGRTLARMNHAFADPIKNRSLSFTQEPFSIVQGELQGVAAKMGVTIQWGCNIDYWGIAYAKEKIVKISAWKPTNPSNKWEHGRPPRDHIPQTLAHELAHVHLGHTGRNGARNVHELEAESVAFLLCLLYGRSYLEHTVCYLTMGRFFRSWRSLHEKAKASEQNVIAAVLEMSGMDSTTIQERVGLVYMPIRQSYVLAAS